MSLGRILVVLPNWFGETLFATPFLRALKQQRPHAFVATLGWPQCREVLLHNPFVDEMLDYDERGIHRSPLGKWRLVRMLRTQRFDTAFILRKSLSRSLLLALSSIPTQIGFANPKSGWLLTHKVVAGTIPQHKANAYLRLLKAADLSAIPVPYDYVVSDQERQEARDWLGAKHILNEWPLVILHPGANWPHKRWAPARFADLADRLATVQHAQVVITGTSSDASLAESITKHMQQSAIALAGQTTLRRLGACLERAHLVISNDTGILHIAAALRRPIVALYGPTSPLITGPLGDSERIVVLHHSDCCPEIPCYQPDHPSHPGMDAITVDEVYTAACKLLECESQNSERSKSHE